MDSLFVIPASSSTAYAYDDKEQASNWLSSLSKDLYLQLGRESFLDKGILLTLPEVKERFHEVVYYGEHLEVFGD